MIHGLKGKLIDTGLNYIVVDVGGIRYKVYIPLNQERLPKIGGDVDIYTYLYARDGGMDLFGFFSEGSLQLFESLVTVSGVGPKSAMAILSVASADQLTAAIAKGEPELLQRSSGVGRRTAERIIVELRDKVIPTGGASMEFAESDQDVFEALLSLGYPRKKAEAVLREIDPKLTDVRDRLKEALRLIKDQ
ncbi:MAG: Holliday junction branch migration protein RuvA [Candidatus Colwellbacteria bacterium]